MDKKYIVAILPYVKKQAEEMIAKIEKMYHPKVLKKQGLKFVFKGHPASGVVYEGDKFPCINDLEFYLKRAKRIVVFASGIVIEAVLRDIDVVAISLPSFVDMCPLDVMVDGILAKRNLYDYFEFKTEDEMRQTIEDLK